MHGAVALSPVLLSWQQRRHCVEIDNQVTWSTPVKPQLTMTNSGMDSKDDRPLWQLQVGDDEYIR